MNSRSDYYSEGVEEKLLPIQKIIWIGLFCLALILVIPTFSSGVNCNGDLSNAGNSCTVPNSLTLNGTYNININGTNAILINGDNVIFDCNGTTIYGNFTSGVNGITSQSGSENITVRNCNIHSYARNIWLINSYNSSVYNNIIGRSVESGIRISNFNNTLIYNNTINLAGVGGIEVQNHILNVSIFNNSISNSGYGIRVLDGTLNSLVESNNIVNVTTAGIYATNDGRINHSIIRYNSIINSSRNGISIQGYNISVLFNNITNYKHEAIDLHNDTATFSTSDSIIIYKNIIKQTTLSDGFDAGEWGINSLLASNVNITANQFIDLVNLTLSELPTNGRGINIGSGDNGNNILIQDNIFTNISGNCFTLRGLNITLINNSLDCQRDYFSEGFPTNNNWTTFNLTNLLIHSNYTYSIRNQRINFSVLEYSSDYHLVNFTSETNGFVYFSYSGLKDFFLTNKTIQINQLSNSLIYFSNGSVACSDISTCDGNINITLTPNNYSYILDNFNVTEGVTRQFSPLSVSGSSTSKTITSQLSQAINATVVVSGVICDEVNKVTYEDQEWTGDNARTVCNSLNQNGYILEIQSGSQSLEFEIGTSSLATTVMKLLLGFLALSVMLFAVGGFFIHAKNNFNDLTPMRFIEYSILLLLFVVIIIVLINYIIDII